MTMGSDGDDDGRNDPNERSPDAGYWHTQTQVFDSQFSPAPSPGEATHNLDELHFDDTFPADDVYGDQAANLAGETQVMTYQSETQVMSPAHETQVLNLGGGTQLLDYLDGAENTDTQLLDIFDNELAKDSDREGSDRTEVLGHDDDLTDDGSAKKDGCQSLENEKKCTSVDQGSPPRFTLIRVASMRAYGLAAESRALKGVHSGSSSVLTNDRSPDQQNSVANNVLETKVVEEKVQEKFNEMNGYKCKAGSSIVRKLFADDDSFSEDEGVQPEGDDRDDGQKHLLQFPICDDDRFAGLSYVDSQEPGDLSQANALKVVEMLIEKNDWLEFDQEAELGKKSTLRESKSMSTVSKGPQSVAKKASVRSMVKGTGIFDWDDNREDEGGGDIFCRKKEEFLGSGTQMKRSLSKPRNLKGMKLDSYRDNEAQRHSRLMVHDLKKNEKESPEVLKKNEKEAPEVEVGNERNSVGELDGQSNAETTAVTADAIEMLNVGPDTQMAAEAMEILVSGEGIVGHDVNGSPEGSASPKQLPSRKRVSLSNLATKLAKKTKSNVAKVSKGSSVLSVKHAKNSRTESVITETKRTPSAVKSKNVDKSSKLVGKRKAERTVESNQAKESSRRHLTTKKQKLAKDVSSSSPIASRTRHSVLANKSNKNKQTMECCRGETNNLEIGALEEKRQGNAGGKASEVSDATANQYGDSKNDKPSQFEKLHLELDVSRYPKRRRSSRKSSGQVNGSDKSDAQAKSSAEPECAQSINGNPRPVSKGKSISVMRKTRSAVQASVVFNSSEKSSSERTLNKAAPVSAPKRCSADTNGRMVKETRQFENACGDSSASAENEETNGKPEKSPVTKHKTSDAACTPPANCMTPVNAASPVCMGNEYFKQSCKKNLSRSSLMKEINRLTATVPEQTSPMKDLRKRRDMASVRVLFSHHLDEDIIKQQKKILARLGASAANSILDATHFVTDKFVRTRNMLEAIASGKPVVTHVWLERIGQARFHICEEPFLLRDTKKEKEFGFSLPVSLARARKRPLLQGRKVLITPNTKPGIEILSSLVKAVRGQAVERMGRSSLKNGEVPDDLLVLSCEEDYEVCVPFLEKGAAIYSSELLLNGIVTQKLEFERHRLFSDHIKRTRSTLWIRKDGHKFQPVKKLK